MEASVSVRLGFNHTKVTRLGNGKFSFKWSKKTDKVINDYYDVYFHTNSVTKAMEKVVEINKLTPGLIVTVNLRKTII